MKFPFRSTLLALIIAAPAAAATPEAAPVSALDSALIASMKAGSAGQGYTTRYNALDPVVMKSYNMPQVEQDSVGFLWSTLPAEQQQELGALFEQFTVASYVSEFNAYSGQQLQILPAEKTLGSKKIIETQLVPAGGGSPTELDYVVSDGGNGWQITDVLLNGTISQVAIHASDFASLVTSGDASQLISALKSKIAALSGGQ